MFVCDFYFISLNFGMKIVEIEFGKFTFLDEATIVAEAHKGVNIDGKKVRHAIELIENEVPGSYVLILDRKADYSIMPVEVYKYFASLQRLKAIAIVTYKKRDFLPDDMEKKIFKSKIEKFSNVSEAHQWAKTIIVE